MIFPRINSEEKLDVLREVSGHLAQRDDLHGTSATTIFDSILQRESLGSTGVGDGVAIPHAKLPELSSVIGALGISRKGIPYDAIDNEPVHLIFMLLVPENSGGVHLKALARIARLLKNEKFRDELLTLDTAANIYSAFIEQDSRI